MECTKCEISDSCVMSCQMGTGKKTAKVMFVADTPTDFENANGEWMIGKAGKLFRDLLVQIGLDIDKDCYFTGAIKCPTPSDDKGIQRQPLRDEIANCSPYLEAEIKIVNPDIIVPMGNVALKQILGKTGITKFRGKAVEQDGRIIFPIMHPSNIFRQPVHAKNFTTDLQNLETLLKDGMSFLEKKEVEYKYLETIEEIEAEVERLEEEAEWLVFDIETTGLNPYLAGSKIICISLTDKTHYGVTIPLQHREFTWPEAILDKVKALLKRLLENRRIKKSGHNGKFDMKWLLYRYNINVKNYSFDPMIAHYIAVSEERGGHGLKELAWEHTDMGGYDNALDEYKQANGIVGNYDQIPWEILREYAAADVDCTMRLIKVFEPMIDAPDKPKWRPLYDIYMEGSYALRDMENDGIKADPNRIEEFDRAYRTRIAEIEEKLRRFPEIVQIEREKHRLFELRALEMKKPKDERDPVILKYNKYKNFEFSFGSTAQLRELLFEKLGLETPFLTDKGKLKKKNQLTIQDYSTGKETLAYLEDKHPIANLLSEWRKLEKLYGTYIAPAKDWIGEDGLVHPSFNLTGTVTSRLSSEAPNAQNFPRKSNNPKEFQYHYGPKKLFVSRFGDEGIILQFDYSQLELRVAAIFSNDPGLMGAYKSGKDLHIYVASKVHKIPESEVTDDQRTAAKAVGFGLLYGKGSKSLAQDMGVSLEEAEGFIATYFKEFAGMKDWIDRTKKQVVNDKYVETLAGFWRRLPGVDSNDRGVQADAMRQAINSPIQGSGASMTLKSIILINEMFKKKKLKSVLAITVHDSIVADVYVPEFKEVYTIMKYVMEHLPFDWITVPIVSEAEVGRDYGTLVGLDSLDDLEGYVDIFDYIDQKVLAKKKKDYEKAGLEMLTA